MVQAISSTIPIRSYSRSSSFKMALFFTLLLGISVSVLGYFNHYFSDKNFIERNEAVIDTELRYLSDKAPDQLPLAEGRIYLLLDSKNKKLKGDLAELPSNIIQTSKEVILFVSGHPEKRYEAKIHTYVNGEKLLVGMDVTKAYAQNKKLKYLSLLGMGLMLIVIITSFLISTFVVGRTGHIAKIAHDIMRTGNLSQRIAQDSSWDDLGYLAQVLNGLLTKIEELMGNVRQVSDNIAHDLRTPLTRLRNKLEALQKEAEKSEAKELAPLCDALTDEADQILNTFAALLRIARIESGQQKSNFTHIRLEQIIRDVIDLYEPLAEEKCINLETDIVPVSYNGDRDLIFQAFANLLDNAIKFTPIKGTIKLMLKSDKTFTLSDNGQGISDVDKEKVFQRFYRTEISRHTAGNGLGLSLVAAVIDLHDCRIALEDASPGLRVKIFFSS